MLGSWRSPAVHETCRGVTHTGSNRLACLARLTLPAVADSIGLGASGCQPFRMTPPSGGRLSYSRICCISAVADCAGFVFSAPCARVNLFPGCPSIPIRDVKVRPLCSWALAVSAPAGSYFFLRGVSPATQTIEHSLAGMANRWTPLMLWRKCLKSLKKKNQTFFNKNALCIVSA